MYKLIGLPRTRAMRVVWCLEELGLDYEVNPAKPQSDEAKKFNPSGKVPALVVGDDVLLDSTAICQFLADKHDGLTYKAGTIERAQMDSWIHFATGEIDAALWVYYKHDTLLPKDRQSASVLPIAKAEFEASLKVMEERLGDNAFVMGDKFTVPDIILAHCFIWAEQGCDMKIPEGKLKDYFGRAMRRRAFIAAAKVAQS